MRAIEGSISVRSHAKRLLHGGLGLVLMAICILGSLAGSAEAEVVHFQEPPPLNGSGSGLTIQAPSGIAIDEATGNVFLGELNNANRVAILGGDPAVPPNDPDPPVGLAAPFTITGFTTANFGEPNGLAFDNNPSSPGFGTLYIADTRNADTTKRTVKAYKRNPVTERYELSGELVPALIGAATREAMGVAVGPDGNVWIADRQQKAIIEFSPGGTELSRIDVSNVFPHSQPTEVGRPKAVAVSASGDVFVMQFSRVIAQGHPKVVKWVADGEGEIDPSEDPVVLADTAGAWGMALDRSEDALYVSFEDRVLQYEATSLAKEGEFGKGVLVGGRGVAVNEDNGRVYVSDNATGKKNVVVFGPSVRTAVVEGSAVTPIGTSTATLRGSVNAEGSAMSFCRFEYGPSDEYGQTIPCAEIVPPDSKPHAVSAALSGLEPSSTYHYRLVAQNASGLISATADATFATRGKPQVREPLPIWVEHDSAKLGAYVNPSGFATNYRFEWGPTNAYGHLVPADFEPSIPAGTEPVKVVANLAGLTAGTAYHFRVVATNASGTTVGPDQRFETLNSCGLILDRCLELVSSADGGLAGAAGDILGVGVNNFYEAAASGSAVVYSVAFGFADATSGGEVAYRGERGDAGWATEQMSPEITAPTPTENVTPARIHGFSRDMSCLAVATAQPLTPDAPRATTEAGYLNLFLREAGGATQVVTSLPVDGDQGNVSPLITDFVLTGISDDCGKVVFAAAYRYPGLPGSGQFRLYEWERASGELRAISEVPGPSGMQVVPTNPGAAGPGAEVPGGVVGVQAPGSLTAAIQNRFQAVSADASHVFFTAQRKLGDGPAGAAEVDKYGVFARVNGSETVDVSQSQTATADAAARYQLAGRDGSRVLFTANHGLTEAPAPGWPTSCNQSTGAGCDLYEYDFSRPEGDRLVDLSLISGIDNPGGAGVLGVAAASADATRVYFLARGRLVPGAGPTEARNLADGTYSVYLHSEEGIAFVGVVRQGDLLQALVRDNEQANSQWRAQATPSGRHFVFQSSANVTGEEPSGFRQVYRFDAATGETVCVSCLRTGGEPAGSTSDHPLENFNRPGKPRRAITDDGRGIFFTKKDALAPGAVEGQPNLYEWRDGQITFLGASFQPPSDPGKYTGLGLQFVGASADGADVYFASRDRLTWEDGDDLFDIYDARQGGGFPQPPAPPAPCDPGAEGSCQDPSPAGSQAPGAASRDFSGTGNVDEPVSGIDRCTRQARQAKRLSARAKRLARNARKVNRKNHRKAVRLNRTARKLAKQAKGASKQAKRCRARERTTNNRRAGK